MGNQEILGCNSNAHSRANTFLIHMLMLFCLSAVAGAGDVPLAVPDTAPLGLHLNYTGPLRAPNP